MHQHTSQVPAPRTTAVVLAGCATAPPCLPVPREFVRTAGRTTIEHTLRIFESARNVDEVIVMMAPDRVPDVERIILNAALRKVRWVLPAAATYGENVRRAIDALSAGLDDGQDPGVLFHDAVSPLVSPQIIADCAAALREHEAVAVALPTESPDGAGGARAPQAFRLSTVRRAYGIAARSARHDGTHHDADDARATVERYLPDVPVHAVEADERTLTAAHPVATAHRLTRLVSALGTSGGTARPARPTRRAMVVFGTDHGFGQDLAALCGMDVFTHGHAGTGSHAEASAYVENALAEAYERAGRVDCVVHVADGLADVVRRATTEQSMLVTHLAPLRIARLAYRYLTASNGQLLLCTADGRSPGGPGSRLTAAGASATVTFARSLAEEWAEDGVRVTCTALGPGASPSPPAGSR
ncbi:SDR family oxidoreductase [Streptomyces gamaensis]|uniref:SDR family oxidoreductase n=1 Tax=Streptomyces gamaensis TaxID=1763542 RepID=A0ABW0YZV4_9ACTN